MAITDIKQELVVFLRNSDIFTTTQRGVTTSEDTGTWSAETNHTLATNPTLVKNVRGITDEDSPEETYETFDSGDLGNTNISSSFSHAQTFTIGATGSNEDFILTDIELKLSKDGTPDDDLVISIKEVDYRGFPVGNTLSTLSVDEGDISDVNTSFETFDMPSCVLKKGKKYALVLTSNTSPVREYSALLDTTAVYSGGNAWAGVTSPDTWTETEGAAFAFKINGQKILVPNVEYWVDYSTGVISFENVQIGAYIILYDQGSTDKIYPDFPRDDLSISSYPRIAVDIIAGTSDAFGIGGASFITGYGVSVVAFSYNVGDIETYIQSIRTAFINASNDFYNISFIKPTAMGPLIESPDRSSQILQRSQDFEIMFEVQTAV